MCDVLCCVRETRYQHYPTANSRLALPATLSLCTAGANTREPCVPWAVEIGSNKIGFGSACVEQAQVAAQSDLAITSRQEAISRVKSCKPSRKRLCVSCVTGGGGEDNISVGAAPQWLQIPAFLSLLANRGSGVAIILPADCGDKCASTYLRNGVVDGDGRAVHALTVARFQVVRRRGEVTVSRRLPVPRSLPLHCSNASSSCLSRQSSPSVYKIPAYSSDSWSYVKSINKRAAEMF
ncbi:hypothetical protein J6590_011080 [Homalodisca vitripennis]|nr:hypothetical protein J6590_011080 [Homalodisca vitripennis]